MHRTSRSTRNVPHSAIYYTVVQQRAWIRLVPIRLDLENYPPVYKFDTTERPSVCNSGISSFGIAHRCRSRLDWNAHSSVTTPRDWYVLLRQLSGVHSCLAPLDRTDRPRLTPSLYGYVRRVPPSRVTVHMITMVHRLGLVCFDF